MLGFRFFSHLVKFSRQSSRSVAPGAMCKVRRFLSLLWNTEALQVRRVNDVISNEHIMRQREREREREREK